MGLIQRVGALLLAGAVLSSLVDTNLRAATYTVTNTNVAGAGSLAEAIGFANTNPGPDVIAFNIAPGGVKTISWAGFLIDILDSVTIDGTTQPGYSGTPIIELVGADANTLGLLFSSGTNVIRGLAMGNFQAAVQFTQFALSNRVEGCWVGLDASGTVVRTNGQGIVIAGGAGNIIGGTNAAARNVIVGSVYSGVYFDSSANNVVKGNYIGVDPTGMISMGNGWRAGGFNDAAGVYLFSSVSNIIGGTEPGARNIMAGNARGVNLSTRSHANVIQGNWFGLNVTGTNVPSGQRQLAGIGMFTDCNGNLIGGTNAGAGNVMAGHAYSIEGYGIQIYNGSLNTIQGNYIGTDASGTKPIGNLAVGITLSGASRTNLIGGTTAAARNVIAANGTYGIQLADSDRNTIQGNYIGTAADGVTAFGNGGSGIYFYRCQYVTIGGTTTAAGNVIANNGTNAFGPFRDGITVLESGGATVFNPIRRNSIYSNAELGIRLYDINCYSCTGHNDPLDTDFGPNDLQNPPILTNAVTASGSVGIRGRLSSKANQTYTVEFFVSPEPDATGFGEGKKYIGQGAVVTDATGSSDFEAFFLDGGYAGQFISATATDANGNTSEFGTAAAVDAPAGVVQFSLATVTSTENTPLVAIDLQRIGGDGSAISVQFSTSNGTAIAGSDYVATNGTVNFAAGVNTATIWIALLNDSVNEQEESFKLILSSPSTGVAIGSRSVTEVKIADDDYIYLYARDATVTKPEAGTTTLFFPIELSQASMATVTVNYATANITATAGVDYQSATGTVTLLPGVTNVLVPVTVFADGLQEGPKSFSLSLTALANATMGDSIGLGTIYDGTQGVLQFSSATYTLGEGDGSATITVTRTGGALGNVSVPFSTVAGTASAGSDYTATNGVLTFNNGVTSRTFTVPIVNDGMVESAETVQLTLGTPTGTSLGTPSAATLTITDNDLPPSVAIRATASQVVISWPTQAAGFQLVGSADVAATNWAAVTNTPVVVGGQFVVTNAVGTRGFYRLKQ